MKLNIGCGNKKIEGWTGVDLSPSSKADIIAPIDAVPLGDGVADEIMAIHVVEHVYSWEVPVALAEWHRLLKRGGLLIVEMPDLLKCCKNIAAGLKGRIHPDQLGIWGIFGDDRFQDPLMIHRSGWWFDRLKPIVEQVGFHKITEHETRFHGAGRGIRDFRMEARKR